MVENDYRALDKDKNFNKEEFERILIKNNNVTSLAVAEYRYQLLKNRDNKNIEFKETKDNIEILFLESFQDKQFIRVLKRLKENGWTIEQAYNKSKTTGGTLLKISTTKNIKYI